jgi:3-dehydroquinate synthase
MPTLNLPNYPIHIAPIESTLPALLQSFPDERQLVVLVDQHTHRHCWPKVQPLLQGRPQLLIEIPPGEQHKNLDTCSYIWEQLLDHHIDRNALMLNLGGGVIGDMGGFCAGTFKRGINFVQIPTTLLSQVDASVGSKLGIDFHQIKNSIGLFGDPQAVLIDPTFLQTLPPEEIRSGFAEMLKHGLIAKQDAWNQLRQLENLADTDWSPLIHQSVQVKYEVVRQDPFEKGRRKSLNFGHTIGHAIESWALENNKVLRHGEAIAIGMIAEAWLSHHKDYLSSAELQEISTTIRRFYPGFQWPQAATEVLLAHMQKDKKNKGKEIRFALIGPIGSSHIDQTVEEAAIRASLDFYLTH